MSGPHGVMDWCIPPRLKLMLPTVFLLLSSNIVGLHGNPITGVDHNLRCVNDYLFTINCSLSIAPSENTSDSNGFYWLTIIETYELTTYVCMLTNTGGDYFCSVNTSDSAPDDRYIEPFSDTDTFEISLCHNYNNQSEPCKSLDKEYTPKTNIKPNPPCCLTVSCNSSQRHFTWKSTYEEYDHYDLIENLKYQLHYYKRGDEHKVIPYDINTDSTNYSVDDGKFVPGTEYAARVRSRPSALYKGQWSDWSSEVHWKMESAVNDLPSNTFVSGLGKVFITLCVMVPLIILLCYAPVKKWRQSSFIPTPAPYFHTLYSDCQGDFKSWVVTQEKTADMLKAEETLQIDMLTECEDIQEEECEPQFHYQFMEGSAYSNITDTCLLGIPYAVSTLVPPAAPGDSLMGLTLSSLPGSPTEGDSGCWLYSDTTLERDAPFYCNEYCTLSAFQQTNLVTAEHRGGQPTKSCLMGTIRVDAITEA